MRQHTPGSLRVSEYDGTTLYADNHVGVASTAPDPLGPDSRGHAGGDYFAPHEDPEVRKANAERIALCWNAHDPLVEVVRKSLRVLERSEYKGKTVELRETMNTLLAALV